MPINEIRTPVPLTSIASSGDLVMDEISHGLARSQEVIAHCARDKGKRKVERFDGIEYRLMSTWLDRRLLHRQKISRLIDLAAGEKRAPTPIQLLIVVPALHRRGDRGPSAPQLSLRLSEMNDCHMIAPQQIISLLKNGKTGGQ